MNNIQVYLFGPPRVERESQLDQVNRKILALLAYLLVTQQPHSREALATLFWPDFDTSGALANLRRDLSRLKELLGERFLIIEREKIQADPEAALWVDVNWFETHASIRPRSTVTFRAWEILKQSIASIASSFSYRHRRSIRMTFWLVSTCRKILPLTNGSFYRLIGCAACWLTFWSILPIGASTQGAFEEATKCIRRWLGLDPLHEPAQRLAMRAYYWAGKSSAALRQYHVLVDLLEKELGVEPEEETTTLYEAIRTRRVPPPPRLEAAVGQKLCTGTTRTDHPSVTLKLGHGTRIAIVHQIRRVGSYPAQTTPLIGRERNWPN